MDVQLGLRGQLRILIRSIQDSSYALQLYTSSLSPNPRTRDPALILRTCLTTDQTPLWFDTFGSES
jgi:hypothetical protein